MHDQLDMTAIARIVPEVTALRRDIHMHPELAYEEHRTAGIIAAGSASLLLVLYVSDAIAMAPFAQPAWLGALPVLISGWLARIWVPGRQGALDEEPLLFAARDRWSWALGAALIGVYALAVS